MSVTVEIVYVTGIQQDVADSNIRIVTVGRTSQKSGTPATGKVTGKTAVADNGRLTNLTNQATAVALTVLYAGGTESTS